MICWSDFKRITENSIFITKLNYFFTRYGLPVNFQAVLMHPNKKSVKRLREVLENLYSHLDSSLGSGSKYQEVLFTLGYICTMRNCLLKFIKIHCTFLLANGYAGIGVWPSRVLPLCILQGRH